MLEQLAEKTHVLPGSELREMIRNARQRTLDLTRDLEDSLLEVPQLEIVNPFRWEMGHVAFFYDVFVLQLLGRKEPVISGGNELYDSFEVAHDTRWTLPLPSRTKTLEYMKRVEGLVLEGMDTHPDPQRTYLYLLSVMHEDMHGEAFIQMRQALGYPTPHHVASPGVGVPGEGPFPGDAEIPGGTIHVGSTPDMPFVFDNEKWTHPINVDPFRIARAPVTNAEFKAFIEDDGYGRRELWSHQGWLWRNHSGEEHPVFWRKGGGGWEARHFDQWNPLKPHTPVCHINWYEAEAFCRWAGRRLPTETEWELAAGGSVTAKMPNFPWGNEPPSEERANLDSSRLGPVDVGAFPLGDSGFGCRQMIGNVWEWTVSPFYPYPGYVVDFPYREYSAPWFGYPKVLKGGAWPTRSRLIRKTYRNFFLPERTDVVAGFRTCAL